MKNWTEGYSKKKAVHSTAKYRKGKTRSVIKHRRSFNYILKG